MSETRDLVEILRHPLTDDEERIADQHVARERDKINATWSERERESRRVDSRHWVPPRFWWME